MTSMRDLANGLATMAAAAGIGITYRSDGSAYAASETAFVQKTMPQTPDRCVVLNLVPLTDVINVPLGQVMAQFAGRGLPNSALDVDDLMDSVFQVFHGSTNLVFGSVTVVQMNRNTVIPMGQDENERLERIDKYYLDLSYPATALRPN